MILVVEQLIYKKTQKVVLEFEGESCVFHDSILQDHMERDGIEVPGFCQEAFDGKEVIKPGDRLFKKAFIDLYFLFSMNGELYEWVKKD